MNFNIYLDDETGAQLNAAAEKAGETRNALIRRAVSEWLKRRGLSQWPDEVRAFTGVAEMVPRALNERISPSSMCEIHSASVGMRMGNPMMFHSLP